MKRLITLAAIAATIAITATCAYAETVEPEVNYDDQVVLISATEESVPAVGSTVEVTDTVTSEAETVATVEATTATTDSAEADDKGSPDTGVEGVAALAGIAVLAAGTIVLTHKK